ncbi:MAG: DUF58 domain-containing protein [Candidatus Lutibacillus vidarii]|jgi:uncharacterized protein (DUF58 family)|nr:DUF58 domain-containing protein [Dermatophilaceae bacterium]
MARRPEVLTSRGRSFLAAGVTLVLGGMAFGFPDLTRGGALLAGLPLVAALLTRRHTLTLRVTRTPTPARVAVDEPASVALTVENLGAASSPILMCEECLDYVLGDRPRFLVGRVETGSSRQVTYVVRSHVRGRHRLGPLRAQFGDPFGLATRHADVGAASDIVIRPKVEPLGRAGLRGVGQGLEGEVPFLVALHGEDDVSVREYRDGDDLRRVHWGATAHCGELMVRQEDRPARRRAVVLLDPRAEAHSAPGPTSSFEWSVSAVASILAHLEQADCAAFAVTARTVRAELASEPIRADEAIDLLAEEQPGDTDDLAELVRHAHWAIGAGGFIVAVVADGSDAGLAGLAALRRPGQPALALVLDSATFGTDGAPSGSRPGVAELFRRTGWSVRSVDRTTSVAAAWAGSAAYSRSPLTMGAAP